MKEFLDLYYKPKTIFIINCDYIPYRVKNTIHQKYIYTCIYLIIIHKNKIICNLKIPLNYNFYNKLLDKSLIPTKIVDNINVYLYKTYCYNSIHTISNIITAIKCHFTHLEKVNPITITSSHNDIRWLGTNVKVPYYKLENYITILKAVPAETRSSMMLNFLEQRYGVNHKALDVFVEDIISKYNIIYFNLNF